MPELTAWSRLRSWIWRGFYWLTMMLLFGLSLVAVGAWNYPAALDWRASRTRLDALEQTIEAERQAIASLQAEQRRLDSDLTALEQAAREEYLFIRSGEEVFIYESPRRLR